jgi:hypothetical protein
MEHESNNIQNTIIPNASRNLKVGFNNQKLGTPTPKNEDISLPIIIIIVIIIIIKNPTVNLLMFTNI